jgi:hypothetical protein
MKKKIKLEPMFVENLSELIATLESTGNPLPRDVEDAIAKVVHDGGTPATVRMDVTQLINDYFDVSAYENMDGYDYLTKLIDSMVDFYVAHFS